MQTQPIRKDLRDMLAEWNSIYAKDAISPLGSLDIIIQWNFLRLGQEDVGNGLIALLEFVVQWDMKQEWFLIGLIMYGQNALSKRLKNGLILMLVKMPTILH